MNAAEIESETRRWFAYASSDLLAAQSLMEGPVPYSRQACFLAQQAAEKALKAALIFVDVRVPRTHDLDRVRNLLPAGWRQKLEPLDLRSLSVWATEARYPGDSPEPVADDADAALALARSLLSAVRDELTARGLSI